MKKTMARYISEKKSYQKDKTRIWNLYINIIKKYKKESELIAYVNTSKLWLNIQQQMGYLCAVA